MIVLDHTNVDRLVLRNPAVRRHLDGLEHAVQQWLLAERLPWLRHLATQSRLDVLSGLRPHHLAVLEAVHGDNFVVRTLHYGITAHGSVPVDVADGDAVGRLCDGFANLCLARSANELHFTVWR